MASFTLSATPTFPVGTTVGAYPASGFPSWAPPQGLPPVAFIETAVVLDTGIASFTSLAPATTYFFGASVSGQARYVTGTTTGGDTGTGLPELDVDGNLPVTVNSSLVPREYDYVFLDPPVQPTTIVYKQGGPTGEIVATLSLTYDGDDVASVVRV